MCWQVQPSGSEYATMFIFSFSKAILSQKVNFEWAQLLTFAATHPCKDHYTLLGLHALIMLFLPLTFSAWRHWGCTTPKIIANMHKQFESAADLDGYEALKPEDQAKVDKAWEEGHVADEDIPETARKPEGEAEEAEEKPKKSRKKAKVCC